MYKHYCGCSAPSLVSEQFYFNYNIIRIKQNLKVKVKQSRYRPGVAQRVPES